MIFAILAYSVTTGLTAISFDWVSLALLRFLVGIAIGSEWATGSSMMAELWPDHARGRGAGLMQCGIDIGNFLASFVCVRYSRPAPAHDSTDSPTNQRDGDDYVDVGRNLRVLRRCEQ